MPIIIAGRAVKIGDELYHIGFESWGRVTRYDPSGSAEFVIKGRGGERKMLVQQGGRVNTRRLLYWHEPILLDLPFQNVSAIRRIMTIMASELGGRLVEDKQDEE